MIFCFLNSWCTWYTYSTKGPKIKHQQVMTALVPKVSFIFFSLFLSLIKWYWNPWTRQWEQYGWSGDETSSMSSYLKHQPLYSGSRLMWYTRGVPLRCRCFPILPPLDASACFVWQPRQEILSSNKKRIKLHLDKETITLLDTNPYTWSAPRFFWGTSTCNL